MFKELPAWGIYIRHARDLEIGDVRLSCAKKDYRMAAVLDDVQGAKFTKTVFKGADQKKKFYSYKSTDIIIK